MSSKFSPARSFGTPSSCALEGTSIPELLIAMATSGIKLKPSNDFEELITPLEITGEPRSVEV
jgi:hypothetical protein